MEERRATILKSIAGAGASSAELQLAIDQAATKQDLEDLYLPFNQAQAPYQGHDSQRGRH
jgi:uncharacterized protein